MNNPKLARYSLVLISTLLAFFGFGTFIGLADHPDFIIWYAFYALAMFIEAVVLLFCFIRLKTPDKSIFWLTVSILGANIVLTIFDQVGPVDMLFMALNIAALAVFYFSRKNFLPA
ncbi:MAG TPA: hypothetical protein PK414_12925 [Anaerolineales bacterium]|nr:hypothetical protein [Anaerolineales bacterium]HNC09815.1 hypothetical protein [Anaerolineales bacterium]